MNVERNGKNGFLAVLLPWAIAALAIGTTIFANTKDTPTRGEMEQKDAAMEARLRYESQAIKEDLTLRLIRIEDKVDDLMRMQEQKPKIIYRTIPSDGRRE